MAYAVMVDLGAQRWRTTGDPQATAGAYVGERRIQRTRAKRHDRRRTVTGKTEVSSFFLTSGQSEDHKRRMEACEDTLDRAGLRTALLECARTHTIQMSGTASDSVRAGKSARLG